MMKVWPVLLLVVLGLERAAADLPVECYFSDIIGTWSVIESARTGKPGLSCDEVGEAVYEKTFTLRFPNTVEDEFGNIGTWTMVYDQGFEVRVGGRSYFAFSYFEKTGANVTSYCNRTFPGWSRDLTVRNWSCFQARKITDSPVVRERHDTHDIHLLESRVHKQDVRFIDAINRHQQNWTAKLYPQFEGLTLDHIFRLRGGQHVRRRLRSVPNHQSSVETRLRAAMLPKQFDWRNVSGVNYVRPVKNQGNCGSCYAFASIGVIESQLLLHSDGTESLDLSAEDIVGCSLLSQGCDGGFPYLIAGRYAQDVGLVSEKCIPYDDIGGACNHKRDSCRHIYTTAYNYVGGYFGACNEDEMMLALVENGPLAVGIEVQDDFMQYSGGIYHHTGITNAFNPLEETNHAVLLVGYGVTEQSEKYWIIQNSWGESWGVKGYVYMRKGTDEIAVESMAVQAVAFP
ncbi:Peptidase C1A papain C-terminal [Trinorchestia longiramus]|nr:Peptidase C1A papain C-terminal [Trinorchestia longiramus]